MLSSAEAYDLTFLYPVGDTAVGRSLAENGEFARVEVDFLIEHAVEARGAMIDVGANIGAIGLPFAAAKPAWKVIALEAHSGLAGLLAANAFNNGLENVEVLPLAAGRARAVADFPMMTLNSGGNFGTHRFGWNLARTRPVAVAPLDEIAPDDTRLVKIDVEGFEPEVLAGAARLIEEVRPIWLVEASRTRPDATRATLERFFDADYRLFWFFAPWTTIEPLRGPPPERLTRGDMNLIALPAGVETPWPLSPVGSRTEVWPPNPAFWPHLRRYGYSEGV